MNNARRLIREKKSFQKNVKFIDTSKVILVKRCISSEGEPECQHRLFALLIANNSNSSSIKWANKNNYWKMNTVIHSFNRYYCRCFLGFRNCIKYLRQTSKIFTIFKHIQP